MTACTATLLLTMAATLGQDAPAPTVVDAAVSSATEPSKPVLFILPNFRGANASDPFTPITAGAKFTMARKDALYYPVFFVGGAFAGLYQFQNQTPSFGQGMAGYGRRYGAALGDQLIANYLSEGVFPAAFRHDPRYFRLGPQGGNFWRRTGYALSRVVVTRNDKGAWRFNWSEWAGVGTATAFSNVYYPEENRTAAKNLQKLGMQAGGDAFYNLLREFWPDLQRKLVR